MRIDDLGAARNMAVDAKKGAKGKIVSVVGAVVDVQFDGGMRASVVWCHWLICLIFRAAPHLERS